MQNRFALFLNTLSCLSIRLLDAMPLLSKETCQILCLLDNFELYKEGESIGDEYRKFFFQNELSTAILPCFSYFEGRH